MYEMIEKIASNKILKRNSFVLKKQSIRENE